MISVRRDERGRGIGAESRGWEGVGVVLVYGAEEEDFRFGRHWWTALSFGGGVLGKGRVGKLRIQSRNWVDGRRVKKELWD